jgi:hypothetical protein
MLKKRKVNIRLTDGTKASQAMRSVAVELGKRLGYKVFRTLRTMPRKKQLAYGMGTDKLTQYRWFEQQGLSALEYTTDWAVVQNWLGDGFTVFGRKYLNASCGKGIVVLEPGTPYVGGLPVYTKYKKKKREFRVHVFKGQVVCVVEKQRKRDWKGERDTKVRNLANGYVFVQQILNLPTGLQALAMKAASVVQSDFAGVDIGYNEKNNDLFVIEVNSAPGIVGSNVAAYCNKIMEYVNA